MSKMRVEYIGHSGVLVELDSTILLFDCVAKDTAEEGLDYHPGIWPQISAGKKLYIFVSHRHGDHYSREIFRRYRNCTEVTYVIDSTVPEREFRNHSYGLDKECMRRLHVVKADERRMIDGICVETMQSTDEGVAFLVTAEGKTIFHAGDLHMWIWEEEGNAYCRDMADAFLTAIRPYEGRTIDLACLILDPRLGPTKYQGIDLFRKSFRIGTILPIHMWKDYTLARKYAADRQEMEGTDRILFPENPGNVWFIEEDRNMKADENE